MNIEIRDSTLKARIQKQLEATGTGGMEKLLAHLLETQRSRTDGFGKIGKTSMPRSAAGWLNWIAAKEFQKTNWMGG